MDARDPARDAREAAAGAVRSVAPLLASSADVTDIGLIEAAERAYLALGYYVGLARRARK